MTRQYVYCNNWMQVPNEPNMPITEREAQIQFNGGKQKTLSPGFVVAALSGKKSQPDYTLAVWPNGEKARFTNFTPGGSDFCVINVERSDQQEGMQPTRVRSIVQYRYSAANLNELLSPSFAEEIFSYTIFGDGTIQYSRTLGEDLLTRPEQHRLSGVNIGFLSLPAIRFGDWDSLASSLSSLDLNQLPRVADASGLDPVSTYSTDRGVV